MLATSSALGSVFTLIYVVSLVLVIWAVVDVARRPSTVMSNGKKAGWIVGSVVGWFFFGLIGAAVAIVYLVGPRRRLNAGGI
jgi:uncharacterized membrane protein YqjE